eukprot:CAMPEP_0114492846 /NCGR_PEP_ID=MMETSP0109-20121206/3781_1 /TAXON_ID=29199 /ORGANISM="Chlorarachnion reptans, Strain CCCM449" /LENGTH=137 /DNA_ID=CAMNT_0001669733 /DNA_START=464 /DNA_END=873 /DNA_ORIENTATION=-
MAQVRLGLIECLDVPVEGEVQVRIILHQSVNPVVLQRRHAAVLRGREPVQEALASGVDEEVGDARPGDRVDELSQLAVGVPVVRPQPAFHGDRDLHPPPDAVRDSPHQVRLEHQPRPEAPLRHLLAGAPAVQVDLVV